MDAAAASRQVRALEDDGLVERRPAPDDGRVTVLRPTRAGSRVFRRIVAVRTSYLADVLADWSATDHATLDRLVNRLVDDLERTPFGALNRATGRATKKARST
jgi:DNA-binding MarR family transcriptional regulator